MLARPSSSILFSSEQFDSKWKIENFFDGNPETEYATAIQGTNTSVEMDFGAPVHLAAFRHVDRRDIATVAESKLIFCDSDGRVVSTVLVVHTNARSAETFYVLPAPVLAQRVKWQVTKVGAESAKCVGGAELSLFTSEKKELSPLRDRIEAHMFPFLEKQGTNEVQPIRIAINHLYAEPADVVVRADGSKPVAVHLRPGANTAEILIPATASETSVEIKMEMGEKIIARTQLQQKPVRPLTIYILPHSHTDIGYTEIQTRIEKKQVNNLVEGIAVARRTEAYPPGARFIWNVEVLWAADLYLNRLDEQQRSDFLEAVKKGQVALNGMYLNELTGLCGPEELLRLFRYATQLADKTGMPIDSAMNSDLPGCTWGTVSAMAQAGIKYFSVGPNYGETAFMRHWENKPFYWVGPDGVSKVLVWVSYGGYALSHIHPQMSELVVSELHEALTKSAYPNDRYPYDVAYVRWSGHGDNAVPDTTVCDFVKAWNAKYHGIKFVISGTSEAFRALETRHGDQLPRVRGDWTPFWEDGAGSSALETAMNRQSCDRLVQAQTLFALSNPAGYPTAAFEEAWNNVMLYSEHTWGASDSVDDPDGQRAKEQWEIKKSYTEQADQQSRQLLAKGLAVACADGSAATNAESGAVDVFNTLSWSRSELVLLAPGQSAAGDRVSDEQGNPVPSQRLTSGELAFQAQDVPPFAARRYRISAGAPYTRSIAASQGAVLSNDVIRVRVDETNGGIVELNVKGLEGNLVDTRNGQVLNEYLYRAGDSLQRNGPVNIAVGEKGPLIASLIIESEAPGCRKLRRELRVVAGQDYVEVINFVDKKRLEAKSYRSKEGKEDMKFAFPFNVPEGDMLLDIPLGAVRLGVDQMPSACTNWFTVGRWADVSNQERGVTWVTLDAPLLRFEEPGAKMPKSSTRLYSWVMNNRWGTNYRAYQEGPVTFRFILRPHRAFDHAEASHFATGFTQPLMARPACGKVLAPPFLQVSPSNILVTGLKPSDDGKGWIVRLYEASGKVTSATLEWSGRASRAVFLSDTSEKRYEKITGPVSVPGHGIVTLRTDLN